MNKAEFQLQGLGDPRLAVHAASALPAWLWSTDGTRILWANPVGAQLFGAANGAALVKKTFGPADQHRRQIARLAGRLPQNGALRLERLRGFGASVGMLATCACSRLDSPNGSHAILIVAAGPPAGRIMPLVERLQRLVQGVDTPIAAFARDGMFIGASDAARPLLGFRNLSEAGLDDARHDALKQGRVERPIGIGHMVLQRVGSGMDVGLVALLEPGATAAAHAHHVAPVLPETARPEPAEALPAVAQPTPDYEAPAQSGEAPAEFALFDEFAEPSAEPALAPAAAQPELAAAPEPVQCEVRTSQVECSQAEAPNVGVPQPETSRDETPSEQPHLETSPEVMPATESEQHEPSPYVEAVADEVPDEVAPTPIEDPPLPPSPPVEAPAPTVASESLKAPSWLDEPVPNTRRHPLRFMWQMDHEGRFSLGSDEFTRLIGARTAAGFGRLWSDIAASFGLDPDGRVMKAFATHNTWSGITLNWPVDGGGHLQVELSGLPLFDRTGNFAGYRGFGVCRDLDGLARLAALRRYEFVGGPPAPQQGAAAEESVQKDSLQDHSPQEKHLPAESSTIADSPREPSVASPAPTELPEPIASDTSQQTNLETPVETPEEMSTDAPKNVVPFRPTGETKPPSLTAVENSAFNELARQLSARLESETGILSPSAPSDAGDGIAERPDARELVDEAPAGEQGASQKPASEKPEWLTEPEPAPRGEARRDKALLDLLPVGVLIYRLDRLLYANRAFLERMGYESLHALEEAGGLDALYVEPGVSSASSTSDTGTPVKISASQPAGEGVDKPATDARLYTISWDDESALALIFSETRNEGAAIAAAITGAVPVAEPSPAGQADAEELGAILDTAAEGIVMFDSEGNINSCNRSAEALFGYDGNEFVQRNLADLFAPESQRAVFDYLASVKSTGVESLLDHGREVLGRVRQGGMVPLSITMGRTRAGRPNFFAVFRDLSQAKKSENELREARRLADRAGTAKADMLARISHEVRTPLNAIIGFAEVMMGERFGALGNERYIEYMKDIRASGERVLSIINDLLDLSRIETGKLDLTFTNQSLNEMVESCVAVMQPQANRERIIIRTSLAHTLPPVIADARALRQITLNLIGNSIHLANAGGQVIVSTALSDFGEVMLRVRDTGHGLNDSEVAAALEPFRTPPPNDQASDGSGVSLSLTKALVEANRAKFHIKTGGRTGTLIEVVFSHATARA
jgi:PAS domain S-box-containing protein